MVQGHLQVGAGYEVYGPRALALQPASHAEHPPEAGLAKFKVGSIWLPVEFSLVGFFDHAGVELHSPHPYLQTSLITTLMVCVWLF